ncbi:MAG: response regulator [Chloroflexota bacterium]
MPVEVLLIEDSPGDIRLMQEAFREAMTPTNLSVVCDGDEALAFLRLEGTHAAAPRPELILLDLNLPKIDGREVLTQIKSDDDLKMIPIIVLTSSEAEGDVVAIYHMQANCCLLKPTDLDSFKSLIKTTTDFWLSLAKLPHEYRRPMDRFPEDTPIPSHGPQARIARNVSGG